MEGRRVNQDEVVNRKIRARDEADQSCILASCVSPLDITLSVNGTETVARVNLDIGGVLNNQRVAAE